MNAQLTRAAVYVGPYQGNYHQFEDDTGQTHFLNHAPKDVKIGQQVTLTYHTSRTSGLWYAT